MNNLFLAGLLLLVSCNSEPKKKVEYSTIQKEYLASLPLEGRVYMEGCMESWGNEPRYMRHCITDYRKLGQAPVVKGGPSAGDIAVGTGLGIIGAKILTK